MNPERAKLKTGLLTPTEARRRLRLPKPIFEVLMRSGLLGPTTNSGHLFAQSLSYFERYGTQWHTQERFGAEGWGQRLISEDTYENMPPVPGMESGAPTDTYTHMRVSAPGTPDNIEETDTGWIAHFYLFPNYFMWPNTTELAMLVPPPLKISEPRDVPGTRHPTRPYPEPSGSLSLVVVSSRERPRDAENPFSAAFDQAYDTAVGVLDYLSVEYDTPLPIVHSALIGVPSGTVHLFFAHRPKVRIMSRGDNLSSEPPHPELRAAYALYREAVSSNNPFHRFLVFRKVYEEAHHVRSQWRKQHKKKDLKVQKEALPTHPALGGDPNSGTEGMPFEEKRQELRRPYRVALAHAGEIREGGKPLTAASSEDTVNVAVKVPVMRYMARVVLKNVAATLDSTPRISAEGGEMDDHGNGEAE